MVRDNVLFTINSFHLSDSIESSSGAVVHTKELIIGREGGREGGREREIKNLMACSYCPWASF